MTWEYSGAIPRLEPKANQIAVIREADTVNAVMIDVDLVSQFQNRGISATDFDPEVIVTTTVADEKLEYWFPNRELEVATEFGASAIVPCDRPVYRDDPPSFRRETVENYAADVGDVVPQFRDAGIDVIPLVKGVTPYERGLCYDVFAEYDITQVAYYCAQYFCYGYYFSALRDRLQQIAVEYDPIDMMLIGLQSETLLPRLPPNVSAAAGQRWLRQIDFGEGPLSVATRTVDQYMETVGSALDSGQTRLTAFTEKRGWA